MMSNSQVELELLCDTIVVLAPGGAVFKVRTVELPEYFILSKTDRKVYLSSTDEFLAR